MYKLIKKKISFLIVFVVLLISNVYAEDTNTASDRNHVLYVSNIIDDVDALDMPVKRSEFAKIVVKASPYRNTSVDFIKTATENKYMVRDIYGNFNEDRDTSYDDLIRACLSLLSYEDKDFSGNKVTARAHKFLELELNKHIDKDTLSPISKQDIINAIYNTLKTEAKGKNKLYKIVFPDMIEDEDGELNVSDMISTKTDGPYFVKRGEMMDLPIDIKKTNVLINGRVLSYDEMMGDINDYGYAVLYYNKYTDTLYAYTERADVALTVGCMKGYVYSINYYANDMVTPKTVDIGNERYKLASDEMIFAFSYAGSFKKDDHLIIVYNKINDILYPRQALGEEKDEGRIIKGSIITAFKIE